MRRRSGRYGREIADGAGMPRQKAVGVIERVVVVQIRPSLRPNDVVTEGDGREAKGVMSTAIVDGTEVETVTTETTDPYPHENALAVVPR